MHFDLKKPCDDCPFLKVGGIRLSLSRVDDIAGPMLSRAGQTFSCHKTVDYKRRRSRKRRELERHCAGALIFAQKNGNQTTPMQIAERLGLYDPAVLMTAENVDAVFDNLDEMRAGQEYR